MRTRTGLGSLGVLLGLSLSLSTACGDSTPESMVDGGAASSAGGASSSGANAGALNLSGSSIGASSSGGSTGNSGAGPIEECAAATAQGELAPVYLVFLLDESGSMGDGENGDRTEKWGPVTAALKSFFADQESAGITASLSIFPQNKNMTQGAANQNMPADCQAGDYDAPVVMPTALPDAKSFADAMTALDPPNEFGTPTFPALSGTIDYAETLLAEDAGRKVAIVMVTDGEPYGCGNQGNTIPNTAMAAADVADHIPTYVIGVGESLDSLNSIAVGGGTKSAFIVSLDDAEQTRKDLLAAVNLIRGQAITCELDIPAPPAGKTLDPDKVDVQFSADGGPATSLPFGSECSGDVAWHYDDAKKPTSIQLCDSACNTVKAAANGKLNVVFGCVDRVVVQ